MTKRSPPKKNSSPSSALKATRFAPLARTWVTSPEAPVKTRRQASAPEGS